MREYRQKPNFDLKSILEVLAVVAPIICLVDCVVIPIVLAILPFVGVQNVWHGISDQFLALVAIVICTPVIVPGYFQHRKKSVLFLMAGGFSLIFLSSISGHIIDNTLHTLIAISGSAMLIKANYDNKRFSKKCGCHSHQSHSHNNEVAEVPLTLVSIGK